MNSQTKAASGDANKQEVGVHLCKVDDYQMCQSHGARMQLISGQTIRKEIQRIAPHSIAVAYIGEDWRQYIDPSCVQNVILSPTLGSNPDAIDALVKAFNERGLKGWDHVHFLDELHAKIYIGETSVAIGSFNLSNNGLSGDSGALIEAGIVTDDPVILAECQQMLDLWKARAVALYTDHAAKKSKLDELKVLRNRASAAELIRMRKRELAEYFPQEDMPFYVISHNGHDAEFTDAGKADPVVRSRKLNTRVVVKDRLTNHQTFLERDKIVGNRWLLQWVWENGSPKDIVWMYIHDVVSHGAVDPDGYTKLARQWKDAKVPEAEPFQLNQRVRKAILNVLNRPEFNSFRPKSKEARWSFEATRPLMPSFIDAIRSEVARIGQAK